jgi:CRISPR/Cas system-associated endonuclease Cas1
MSRATEFLEDNKAAKSVEFLEDDRAAKAKHVLEDYITQLQKHEKTLRSEFSITQDEIKKVIEKLKVVADLTEVSKITGPLWDALSDTKYSLNQLHILLTDLDAED